jgi:hypothetical protein
MGMHSQYRTSADDRSGCDTAIERQGDEPYTGYERLVLVGLGEY